MVMGQAQEVWSGVTSRIDRRIRLIRRTTPGPVLVRSAATAGTLVALLVALPPSAMETPAVLGLAVVAAAGVGLFPRTRWATVTALLALIAVYDTDFGVRSPTAPPAQGLRAALARRPRPPQSR